MAAKMMCWFRAALIACGALISMIASDGPIEARRVCDARDTAGVLFEGDPFWRRPRGPALAARLCRATLFLASSTSIPTSPEPWAIPASPCAYSSVSTPKERSPRFKLVDHKEPIVLVGVPERRVVEALNTLIGTRMGLVASGTERAPQPDIVSGATVTVLVMADSVVRSAVRLMKSGRISPGGHSGASGAPETETKSLDMTQAEKRDWQSLLGDGSVRRLKLTVADVNQAFEKSRNKEAAAHPEPGNPDDTFIDLYVALARAPASAGAFSVIPATSSSDAPETRPAGARDRRRRELLLQGIRIRSRRHFRSHRTRTGRDPGTRFRDRNHERLGALEAEGAPTVCARSAFSPFQTISRSTLPNHGKSSSWCSAPPAHAKRRS